MKIITFSHKMASYDYSTKSNVRCFLVMSKYPLRKFRGADPGVMVGSGSK